MTESRPGPFLRRRVGGVDWEILAGMEEHLLSLLEELSKPPAPPSELMPAALVPRNRTFTIKTNRPGLPPELRVKVYSRRLVPGRGWSLRSGPARREWRMAEAHRERGLPVAGHLALGVRKRFGLVQEEFLIQEFLGPYAPFPEFFRTTFRPELPGVGPEAKRRLIRDLAALVRSLHDHGVSRPEIAPPNILAATRSSGGVKFAWVDLDHASLRLGPPAPAAARLPELAHFYESFSPLLSQSYRIRFLQEYFRADRLSQGQFRERVSRIVDLSHELARKEESKVLQAVNRRQDPYFWFDSGRHRIFLRKPLYQNSLLEVAEKLAAGEDPGEVRVKRVRGESPLDLTVITLATNPGHPDRDTPARWGFLMSALLDHHGVTQFRAMAAIEPKSEPGGWLLRMVPGRVGYSLAEFLALRAAEEFSGDPWDRKFLIRVARFVMRLHDLGWGIAAPAGDDLWVRFTAAGTHEIILASPHKLRSLRGRDPEMLLRGLFELWRALPLSPADGIMLAEEYLQFSRRLARERKDWRQRFLDWQREEAAHPGPVPGEK